MRKQDRIGRSKLRHRQFAVYAEQDTSVDTFVKECRIAMSPAHFDRFYSEASATAGNAIHIFEALIDALSRTATKITPGLRKAIEFVLEMHGIDRSRMPSLATLDYDEYWKRKYGYD